MKIPETIDEQVPYDAQCLVSPGEVVQMIVMDILTGRQALVHMADWAMRLDVEKLLRPGVQASYFNDDAIARHLDRISDAEVIHSIHNDGKLAKSIVDVIKEAGQNVRRVFGRALASNPKLDHYFMHLDTGHVETQIVELFLQVTPMPNWMNKRPNSTTGSRASFVVIATTPGENTYRQSRRHQ